MSEEAAKLAWLARLDQEPSWRTAGRTTSVTSVPTTPSYAAPAMPPRAATTEEEAKRAWLARLDEPTWGRPRAPAAAMPAPATYAPVTYAAAPVPASSEEKAKRAWLARLDEPLTGRSAPRPANAIAEMEGAVVSTRGITSAPAMAPKMTEEEAKRAWLARLD
eukprot:scaffold483_cov107-Isochrysis_galbana.AAC.5